MRFRKEADDLYLQAIRLFKNKQYEAAKEKFSEVHLLIPNYKKVKKYLKRTDRIIDKQLRALQQKQEPKVTIIKEAKEKIRECQTRLAEREIYVGKFYFRRGDFFSALDRFEKGVHVYPNAGLTDRALYYAGQCYRKLRNDEKADEAFQRLEEDVPDAPLRKKIEID